MSVFEDRELATPAVVRSARVSASEEQGLIANAAQNSFRQSSDDVGSESRASQRRRAGPAAESIVEDEPKTGRPVIYQIHPIASRRVWESPISWDLSSDVPAE